ncbi:MAG TPA: chlororespiratory reduction protein 7 [Allocoleopsis sp.]
MPDPLMYRQDHFVVLEANQPEQFFTAAELLTKLETLLAQRQDDLPQDLQKISSIPAQAQYLLDTSCELDMGPGNFLQWYAVRLEKET